MTTTPFYEVFYQGQSYKASPVQVPGTTTLQGYMLHSPHTVNIPITQQVNLEKYQVVPTNQVTVLYQPQLPTATGLLPTS